MPRGRKVFKPKGRNKRYTTQEEVRDQEEKKQREKDWKRKKGQEVSDSEEESDDAGATSMSHGAPGDLPPSSSDESNESSDSRDEDVRPSKGVEGLIEVQNPNRVASKTIKAKDVDVNAEVTLSRREREEVEKQRAAESYRRLHEAGKTDEARRDLARLAIIRQQREDNARKREAEKKAAEAEAAAKKK